jgi:hypothetical protein
VLPLEAAPRRTGREGVTMGTIGAASEVRSVPPGSGVVRRIGETFVPDIVNGNAAER